MTAVITSFCDEVALAWNRLRIAERRLDAIRADIETYGYGPDDDIFLEEAQATYNAAAADYERLTGAEW